MSKIGNKLYNVIIKEKNSFSLQGIFLYFLTVLSIIYAKLIEIKASKAKILSKDTFKSKLISIGNITMGGTGKTPLAGWLASYLASKNYNVGIVLRGYKKNHKNNKPILLGVDYVGQEDQVHYFGDEALLLKELSPHTQIMVCADRIKAINRLIDDCNCSVIILDDAFQQFHLPKSMDIVCFDPLKPLGNEYVIPRGNLREKPQALNRGSHFVFCKGYPRKRARSKILAVLEDESKGIFACDYRIIGAYYLVDNLKVMELNNIKGIKTLILSAIGNPDSFVESLKDVDITGQVKSYPDHFSFQQSDIDEINDFILQQKIEQVVTTEKDGMRLKPFKFEVPVYVIEGEITPPQAFIDEVDRCFNNENVEAS